MYFNIPQFPQRYIFTTFALHSDATRILEVLALSLRDFFLIVLKIKVAIALKLWR